MLSEGYLHSPLGWLKLEASRKGLCSLQFINRNITPDTINHDTIIDRTKDELKQYFSGERTGFTVPLDLQGTDFQIKVWQQLLTLEYGSTISYRALATSIGNIKSIRAVGRASGTNKIPIIIPCHRVIGKDGSLTGYAGGLERKAWLLKHENTPAMSQISMFDGI